MLPNECIFQQLNHNDEILSNLIVNVFCNISLNIRTAQNKVKTRLIQTPRFCKLSYKQTGYNFAVYRQMSFEK